eukprot:9071823-Pyramimonas_sp.AAC.1
MNHNEDKAKVHITFLKRRAHQKKAASVKVFMKPRDLSSKLGYTAEGQNNNCSGKERRYLEEGQTVPE